MHEIEQESSFHGMGEPGNPRWRFARLSDKCNDLCQAGMPWRFQSKGFKADAVLDDFIFFIHSISLSSLFGKTLIRGFSQFFLEFCKSGSGILHMTLFKGPAVDHGFAP